MLVPPLMARPKGLSKNGFNLELEPIQENEDNFSQRKRTFTGGSKTPDGSQSKLFDGDLSSIHGDNAADDTSNKDGRQTPSQFK
jgi:hypothetical protein